MKKNKAKKHSTFDISPPPSLTLIKRFCVFKGRAKRRAAVVEVILVPGLSDHPQTGKKKRIY